MIRQFTLVLFSTLLCGLVVFAQTTPDSEQKAEALRSQLRSLSDKEAGLQARAQQLEEDLKPENIQRSVALIGTTRPEDLREQRRVQLERERSGIQAQLEEIQASRTRLEAAITTAVRTPLTLAPPRITLPFE